MALRYQIGRDSCNNKIVRVLANGKRGFTIQTNGNPPVTHLTNRPMKCEIIAYVSSQGTDQQKQLMELEG